MTQVEVPVFPLGSALLPGASLPLHIFEPRYRQMLDDVLATEPVFGVVLITRGSEVGGGETRTNVGTIARIVEHRRFDDGRAAVATIGESTFDVVEWLPDNPYPQALVTLRAPQVAWGPGLEDKLVELTGAFVELVFAVTGRRPRPDTVVGSDPETIFWSVCRSVPLGDLDRQALLATTDLEARIDTLLELIWAGQADIELMRSLE